jgi:hypothetical protein
MDNSNLETIKPDKPRLDFGNSYLLELKRKGHRLMIGKIKRQKIMFLILCWVASTKV